MLLASFFSIFLLHLAICCEVQLYPEGQVVGTKGGHVNFECKVIDCGPDIWEVDVQQNGRDSFTTAWCKDGIINGTYREKICNVTLATSDNDTRIRCAAILSPSQILYSNTTHLLVQSTVNPVSNLNATVVIADGTVLNVTWDPPPVLTGLPITYSITVSNDTHIVIEDSINITEWSLNVTGFDPCQLLNVSVEAVVNKLISDIEWQIVSLPFPNIDPVSNLKMIVTGSNYNLTWSPPSVLYCVNLIYFITIFTKVFSSTDTHINLLDYIAFDPCKIINVSITAKDTIHDVTSNGTLWYGSLPDIPPNNYTFHYTSVLLHNGSALIQIEFEAQCDCPGKIATYANLMASYENGKSVTYRDIPVKTVSCRSIITSTDNHSLLLTGNQMVGVVLQLGNKAGISNQQQKEINLKGIQSGWYTNATESNPVACFYCGFTDDELINNQYSNGCNVSYQKVNISTTNHIAIQRENEESNVTSCVELLISGFYYICYMPLASIYECQVRELVYIAGISQPNGNFLLVIYIIAGTFFILLVVLVTLFIFLAVCLYRKYCFNKLDSDRGLNNESERTPINSTITNTDTSPRPTFSRPAGYRAMSNEQYTIPLPNSTDTSQITDPHSNPTVESSFTDNPANDQTEYSYETPAIPVSEPVEADSQSRPSFDTSNFAKENN